MAITSTGLNAATNLEPVSTTNVENKTVLGKDDFMTLLLVQLQHQDPTEPMESGAILTQTSQLAGLEATENTNTALEKLAVSLSSSQEFSTIAAIGKTADLGSDSISIDEGQSSSFEIYFPEDIQAGTISITNSDGNQVATIDVEANSAGVYQFDWNGLNALGNPAEGGIYKVTASYSNPSGETLQTRLGAYPIESVRFESGQTLVKVGSSYVPLSKIVEIY